MSRKSHIFFNSIISILVTIYLLSIFIFLFPLGSKKMKVFFSVFSSPLLFVFLIIFFEHLTSINEINHPYIVFILSTIIFPTLLNGYLNESIHQYLSKAPSNGIITLEFDLDLIKTVDTGIGNELHSTIYVNDTRISGKTSSGYLNNVISVNINDPIYVKTSIIEHDDATSDCAEKTTQIDHFLNNRDHLNDTVVFSQNIKVREKGGRRNAGAHADFTANYTVKRIVPDIKTLFCAMSNISTAKELILLFFTLLVGLFSLKTVRKYFKSDEQQ